MSIPSSRVVEEAGVRSVELVESVEHVRGGVRVHQVQVDVHAERVRRVDQRAQLVGGAVPTA